MTDQKTREELQQALESSQKERESHKEKIKKLEEKLEEFREDVVDANKRYWKENIQREKYENLITIQQHFPIVELYHAKNSTHNITDYGLDLRERIDLMYPRDIMSRQNKHAQQIGKRTVEIANYLIDQEHTVVLASLDQRTTNPVSGSDGFILVASTPSDKELQRLFEGTNTHITGYENTHMPYDRCAQERKQGGYIRTSFSSCKMQVNEDKAVNVFPFGYEANYIDLTDLLDKTPTICGHELWF